MRVLFSGVPAFGHLMPVLPLADAAHATGDEVLVATHSSLAGVVTVPFRADGPAIPELVEANTQRTGIDVSSFRTDDPEGMAAAAVDLFTATMPALTVEGRLTLVEETRPDLLVGDVSDYVTQTVAAITGLPWAAVTHSPVSELGDALDLGRDRVLAEKGLHLHPRIGVVETWPEWLEDGARDWTDGIAVRPQPFDGSLDQDSAVGALSGRPRVLVTMGTIADDPDLLRDAVEAALASDHDVIVTTGLTRAPEDFDFDLGRVAAVSFAPLGALLDHADAVVAAGGAGTTLAALSRGLPIAFLPQVANQPHIAAEVERYGAGVVVDKASNLSAALERMLGDGAARAGAVKAAARLAERPTPAAAWESLRSRL